MTLRSLQKGFRVIGSAVRMPMYSLSTISKIAGVHPRDCPICGFRGNFRAFGDPPRWDAQCPSCSSLERHRLFALLLRQRPDLIRGRTIHFAPEPSVTNLLRPLAEQYQSADLFMNDCDLVLNLEAIKLPDQSVDTFIVSHVLEHVDDRKALSELSRCLRIGGTAILMVPIVEAWSRSYENASARTDAERHLHFGQADHVRYYGADFRDRVRSRGFELEEYVAGGDESAKFGLLRGETIFIARRAH
jgi:SAM-dependent methyltransferase